ncbi:MAG TPA: hypothetical protein VNI20_05115 [Fimbriimonadaceae bacterium]|nr:hypothetical protein [Fimbriimonadaceae bacterium]
MCRHTDIRVEHLIYTIDIFASVPFTTIDRMLVLSCRNCRHVHLIHPREERLVDRPLVMN